MRPVLTAVLCLSLTASGPAWASARAQAWVSASARSGDGSKTRPFPTVRQALESGAKTLLLAPGAYPETVEIQEGVSLVGTRDVILTGDRGKPALVAHGGRVKGLRIETSGEVGIRIDGDVQLDDVQVKVLGGTGIAVEHGTLRWTGGGAVATGGPDATNGSQMTAVPETPEAANRAIAASPTSRLRLSHVTLSGPFQTGITAEHADVTLVDVEVRGARLGVRLRGDSAHLRRVRIEDGSDVGVFVGRGSMEAFGLVVSGHQYGVLTGMGSDVVLHNPTISKSANAGVATAKGRLRVLGGDISGSGSFGGMELSGSHSDIEGTKVRDSVGEGIAVLGGDALLRGVTVDGVRDPEGTEGEGILARRSKVRLSGVKIARTSGLGLFASEAADVQVDDVSVSSWGVSAVGTERSSQIHGVLVRLARGTAPQLIASEGAGIQLSRLELSPAGTLDVQCAADAPIRIEHLTGASPSDPDCLIVGGTP